jgi:hypothetical protein
MSSDIIDKSEDLVGTTNNWLNAQTIESPVTTPKVQDLVDRAVNRIKDGKKAYMNRGDAEQRAYLDGKPVYEDLVKDIKKRATTEGWP